MILPTNSNNIVSDICNLNSSIVIIPTEGSHKAYLTSQLYKSKKKPFVVILKDINKALSFIEELNFFLPDDNNQIIFFPGYPTFSNKSVSQYRETSIKRL